MLYRFVDYSWRKCYIVGELIVWIGVFCLGNEVIILKMWKYI